MGCYKSSKNDCEDSNGCNKTFICLNYPTGPPGPEGPPGPTGPTGTFSSEVITATETIPANVALSTTITVSNVKFANLAEPGNVSLSNGVNDAVKIIANVGLSQSLNIETENGTLFLNDPIKLTEGIYDEDYEYWRWSQGQLYPQFLRNVTSSTGAVAFDRQGYSVALSADGKTAAFGAPGVGVSIGGVWIFTRGAGGVWTQQGPKLVGSGAIGISRQGSSVALSADGNTLAVGDPRDDVFQGAVWIFVRSGTTWTQQGPKLVGTGATGNTEQGFSVDLSADGNTLAVGGPGDNGGTGAVWIFVRTGGVWTQEGSKLVGTGAINPTEQGSSVALSANGNILAVGGPGDDSNKGAVWIFNRKLGVWTQFGSKITASIPVSSEGFGACIDISANGRTLAIGSNGTNAINPPSVWVYTLKAGTWNIELNKVELSLPAASNYQDVSLSSNGSTLVFSGSINSGDKEFIVYTRTIDQWVFQKSLSPGAVAGFGCSNALSADGNILAVGAFQVNGDIGEVYFYS